ncbi:MAG: non-canonical purine NTP pyrophosphatase [Sphaerochaetaceae bacterium]|nr:non-canonical purine NTP pyrophosphatase [Sphaerochaetaceae bacterium]
MEIMLASGNIHKKQEFQALFPHHNILVPQDCGLTFDVEETGSSFIENALQKANGLKKQNPNYNCQILADDSGLIVQALPGELGIKTARYGQRSDGTILSSTQRNALLLENMKNVKIEDRTAFFICTLVLLKEEEVIYIIQEKISGHIIEKSLGTQGFGYDPVFWVDKAGCTMAQLSSEEKNIFSHRGKAVEKLKLLMNN